MLHAPKLSQVELSLSLSLWPPLFFFLGGGGGVCVFLLLSPL